MRYMGKTAGRPKKPQAERKTNVLRVCLTPVERQIIEAAARYERRDTSAWARSVLVREAEKTNK